MTFSETGLNGSYYIDIKKIEDDRGFYARGFCKNEFAEYGLNTDVMQSNIIYSKRKGTLRGLHLQLSPFEECKVIRCTKGAIYDVIIDLRPQSPSYTKWIGAELSADNFRMLYVPEGFAHGYLTLEDETHVTYHVSQFYTPGHEIGVRWNDPAFNIKWPIKPEIISEKDKGHPDFLSKSAIQ